MIFVIFLVAERNAHGGMSNVFTSHLHCKKVANKHNYVYETSNIFIVYALNVPLQRVSPFVIVFHIARKRVLMWNTVLK